MISNMKKPMKKTKEQTELTEETALAFFARHLDGLKWQYHRYNDQPVLFCGFNGVDALWDFNMVARAKNDGQFLLAISSFIPNKARPDRRVAVAVTLLKPFNANAACGRVCLLLIHRWPPPGQP